LTCHILDLKANRVRRAQWKLKKITSYLSSLILGALPTHQSKERVLLFWNEVTVLRHLPRLLCNQDLLSPRLKPSPFSGKGVNSPNKTAARQHHNQHLIRPPPSSMTTITRHPAPPSNHWRKRLARSPPRFQGPRSAGKVAASPRHICETCITSTIQLSYH
jgi:hypothetical protein